MMGPDPGQWHGTGHSVSVDDVMIAGRVVVVKGAEPGLLPAPVGLPVDDELVGGGLQPVDGRLGQQLVGHEPEPLILVPGSR